MENLLIVSKEESSMLAMETKLFGSYSIWLKDSKIKNFRINVLIF